MANFAVGVASCGSSQATTNPSNVLQFPSQHQNQHQQAALLSHTESATPNQAFDTQIDIPLHPLYGWENQNLFDDSGQNLLENILEGIDEENFTRYPWLYNSTDAKDWASCSLCMGNYWVVSKEQKASLCYNSFRLRTVTSFVLGLILQFKFVFEV